MKCWILIFTIALSTSLWAKSQSPEANRPNLFLGSLHLIQSDDSTGFALYRTSRPSRRDMREFCEMGLDEIMVLSGDAEEREFKYQDECPTLKVVYNIAQDGKKPLSRSFLSQFDDWVAEARAMGKKIAFRCTCGCHRTGRLAGYYQMKYQGLTHDDAKIIMNKHGKWMFTQRQLYPQLQAIEDYIKGRPCSVEAKHCVIMD